MRANRFTQIAQVALCGVMLTWTGCRAAQVTEQTAPPTPPYTEYPANGEPMPLLQPIPPSDGSGELMLPPSPPPAPASESASTSSSERGIRNVSWNPKTWFSGMNR
ncbi:hypothetical protein Plim_2298 [Planctopirus limnophila DSM 3776]|uniref:Uncharacterized protein n=1 Tax=Planctopirus limnophila (strain ATCC 43296 / DSM 3776 / IFAM 1008 / Mu 290) TaxID=521674 RepID=D5SNL0_PLAL2|nr:hypothetical protein [Planctopirus limnophila]ADG68124.1 hypothetical protein Plim_2298 [Planctopirus limnophila DSM 3776]